MQFFTPPSNELTRSLIRPIMLAVVLLLPIMSLLALAPPSQADEDPGEALTAAPTLTDPSAPKGNLTEGIFTGFGDPVAPTASPMDAAGFCGRCEDERIDGEYQHQAMQFLFDKSGDGPGLNENPQWHPTQLKPGGCLQTHGFCYVIQTAAEDVRTEIATAVALRDVVALARLADLPAVVVVPERTAIQILGCDGETVVSHVQLPKNVLTEVQAVLTDADR